MHPPETSGNDPSDMERPRFSLVFLAEELSVPFAMSNQPKISCTHWALLPFEGSLPSRKRLLASNLQTAGWEMEFAFSIKIPSVCKQP